MEADPGEAVKWIRLAAEQEHAEAQAMIGRLYYVGHGVPKDYSEALQWYRRAIGQNDPKAQFYLGLLYYNGHGVIQDEAEAVKWIRRAADQGDAEAQFEMGGMYSRRGRLSGLRRNCAVVPARCRTRLRRCAVLALDVPPRGPRCAEGPR